MPEEAKEDIGSMGGIQGGYPGVGRETEQGKGERGGSNRLKSL